MSYWFAAQDACAWLEPSRSVNVKADSSANRNSLLMEIYLFFLSQALIKEGTTHRPANPGSNDPGTTRSRYEVGQSARTLRRFTAKQQASSAGSSADRNAVSRRAALTV